MAANCISLLSGHFANLPAILAVPPRCGCGGDAGENAARGFHDTSVDEEIEIPAIARVLNGASIRWGALQSQFRGRE